MSVKATDSPLPFRLATPSPPDENINSFDNQETPSYEFPRYFVDAQKYIIDEELTARTKRAIQEASTSIDPNAMALPQQNTHAVAHNVQAVEANGNALSTPDVDPMYAHSEADTQARSVVPDPHHVRSLLHTNTQVGRNTHVVSQIKIQAQSPLPASAYLVQSGIHVHAAYYNGPFASLVRVRTSPIIDNTMSIYTYPEGNYFATIYFDSVIFGFVDRRMMGGVTPWKVVEPGEISHDGVGVQEVMMREECTEKEGRWCVEVRHAGSQHSATALWLAFGEKKDVEGWKEVLDKLAYGC